ncbi:MAG: fused MFS/spermidine synthase, partial [Rhodospirillales bacterium]|nr:fused MFS/spermidine synthase [Rhodospirillales bacterium]
QAEQAAPSIGIVGLGAGALACYRRPGEDWRFYEIDPLVVRLATDGRFFDLMPRCAPDAPIIVGDARLTLAQEADTRFDLLVIDAFSSDAIPMHLLTREAIALYTSRLRDGGAIVLHISNRYLDLRPIVAALVADQGMVARAGLNSGSTTTDNDRGTDAVASSPSLWVAITRTPADLEQLRLSARWTEIPETPGRRVWTDDYSNILKAIRWGGLNLD